MAPSGEKQFVLIIVRAYKRLFDADFACYVDISLQCLRQAYRLPAACPGERLPRRLKVICFGVTSRSAHANHSQHQKNVGAAHTSIHRHIGHAHMPMRHFHCQHFHGLYFKNKFLICVCVSWPAEACLKPKRTTPTYFDLLPPEHAPWQGSCVRVPAKQRHTHTAWDHCTNILWSILETGGNACTDLELWRPAAEILLQAEVGVRLLIQVQKLKTLQACINISLPVLRRGKGTNTHCVLPGKVLITRSRSSWGKAPKRARARARGGVNAPRHACMHEWVHAWFWYCLIYTCGLFGPYLTSLATSLSLLPILSKMDVRLSCKVALPVPSNHLF